MTRFRHCCIRNTERSKKETYNKKIEQANFDFFLTHFLIITSIVQTIALLIYARTKEKFSVLHGINLVLPHMRPIEVKKGRDI
jgi:hypothetical protein